MRTSLSCWSRIARRIGAFACLIGLHDRTPWQPLLTGPSARQFRICLRRECCWIAHRKLD